jgi:hypothetical protein
VQRALALVLGHQLGDQPADPLDVALTGRDRHHVTLRVDDHQGRPRAHRVLLPGVQIGIIQHRVPDVVALHRRGERVVIGLVRELRGVHPDHHEHVRVVRLQRPQLVEHVQAVDAAEGPEVQQDDLAAQVGERDRASAGVQPAAGSAELGRPDAGTPPGRSVDRGCPLGREVGGHIAVQPGGSGVRSPTGWIRT